MHIYRHHLPAALKAHLVLLLGGACLVFVCVYVVVVVDVEEVDEEHATNTQHAHILQ